MIHATALAQPAALSRRRRGGAGWLTAGLLGGLVLILGAAPAEKSPSAATVAKPADKPPAPAAAIPAKPAPAAPIPARPAPAAPSPAKPAVAAPIAASSPAKPAPVPAKPAPDPAVLAALVKQLGDEAWPRRREAEEALRGHGLAARAALLAGLQDRDPEIRRGCRRLLSLVLQADFRGRLEAFVNDKDGTGVHDLPGWKRFAEVFGKGKEARAAFVEMLRAEPVLMEASEYVDAQATHTCRVRWQQVLTALFGIDGQQHEPPSFGTMAALLFLAVDTDVPSPPEFVQNPMESNFFYQQAFQKELNDGPLKPIARRILARWIQRTTTPTTLMQKFQLAVQFQIKETLGTALDFVKSPKASQDNPIFLAYAIEVVARTGGKPYAATLVPLLTDKREFMRFTMEVKGKQETVVVQLRDVVLAWLIELTGQDPAAYDMAEAKQWFEQVRKYPQNGFNFQQFGYRDPAKRDKALAKWEGWLKAHPLASAPPRPPDDTPPVKPAPPPPPAPKQRKAKGKDEAEVELESPPMAGLAIADHLQIRKLADAEKLVATKSYAPAAAMLGQVLTARFDYAYRPARSSALYRRLKSAAEELLGRFPPEALAEYDLLYGAVARRALGQAVAAGDVASLGEVVQSYFHTDAGAEAAYLLGEYYRSTGQFHRAAIYLQRLTASGPRARRFEPALSIELAVCCLKTGMREAARQALARVRVSHPNAAVQQSGRELRLFDGDDPVTLLERLAGLAPVTVVASPGDRAPRAAAGDSAVSLSPKYRIATTNAALQPSLEKMIAEDRAARRASFANLTPLTVGSTVLARTPTQLLAFDFRSAAPLWAASLEDPLEDFLIQSDTQRQGQSTAMLRRGLQRRLFQDRALGTLSSDGRLVYGLECMPFDLGPGNPAVTVSPEGRRRLHAGHGSGCNLLTACDVRTGKRVWEVGGEPGIWSNPLAGVFFLGPPLPLAGQLHVVGQTKRDTRVYVLAPATGAVVAEWVVAEGTADPPQDEVGFPWNVVRSQDPQAIASPAFSDGILVCCTSDNRYMGVDLGSRSVVWTYHAPQDDARGNTMRRRMMGLPPGPIDRPDRWFDCGLALGEGHVLLTPLGTDELVCLKLDVGSRAWSAPRGDGLYVAGVHGHNAIVVGRSGLRALRLADGKPAWKQDVAWPGAGVPCGRAYCQNDRCYAPLSTGEIVAVDLKEGTVAARSRSPGGETPGNLVACAGGAVLSQTVDALARLDPSSERLVELETALRARPDDAALRTDLARTLLALSRRGDAVEQLRKAVEQGKHEPAKALLAEALVEGLQLEFDAFAGQVESLEKLLDQPALRSRVLRETAAGWLGKGRHTEALAAYLRWIDTVGDTQTLVYVDVTRAARIDRLVQADLARLWAEASPEFHGDMDRRIAARFASAHPRDFLTWFAFHPLAHEARLRWAREHLAPAGKQGKRLLAAELLLRRVAAEGSAAQQGEAIARLAGLLAEAQRPEEAAALYRRLAGPLADAACVNGKTGRELAAALPANDPVRQAMAGADPWPAGEPKKEIETRKPDQARGVQQVFPVWAPGAMGRFAGMFSPQGPVLIERGSCGQERWRMRLDDVKSHPNYMGYLYGNTDAVLAGHLLVAMVGNRVAAIDTLSREAPVKTTTLGALGSALSSVVPAARVRVAPAKVEKAVEKKTEKKTEKATEKKIEKKAEKNAEKKVEKAAKAAADVADANTDRRRKTPSVAPNAPPPSAVSPRLLWAQDSPVSVTGQPGENQAIRMRLQVQRNVRAQSTPLPSPVLATESYVAFEQNRNLMAADPMTGSILWMHEEIGYDADLTGDNELVFVQTQQSSEAIVLSAADGHIVGRRPAVPVGQRLLSVGRLALTWDSNAKASLLTLFDPWTQKPLWQRTFDAKAQCWLVDGQEVAVLSPQGKFAVVSVAEGRDLLASSLEPLPTLDGLVVRKTGGRYLVLTSRPSGESSPFGEWLPPTQVRVAGWAQAVDAQGKKLWSAQLPDQWFSPWQPADLPAVFFLRMYNKAIPNPGGGFRAESVTQLLCLDARTGKTLLQDSTQANDQMETIVAPGKSVEFHTTFRSLKLTYAPK